MGQPQKLFVNNTSYTVQGIIDVRAGNNPGTSWGTVQFSVNPNAQVMVQYGDSNDPYVDQLTLSAVTNGAMILSDQVILIRGTQLDNLFNMNDTVYISLQGESFVITTGNTWTT